MSGKAELSPLPMKEMLKPTSYVAPYKAIIKLEAISNDIDGIAQSDIAGHELVACFFALDNATYANISRKYSVTVENPF